MRRQIFAGLRAHLFELGLLGREGILIGHEGAEKGLEETALLGRRGRLRLVAAIGIVTCKELLPRCAISVNIPRTFILREACLHLLNLCIKASALWRRSIEQEELTPVAAERAGPCDGAVEFRALL